MGSHQLLSIGSCGLHNVQNLLKTAMIKIKLNLLTFCKALSDIFKHSPTGKGDYSKIASNNLFPLNVFSVR